MRNLYSASYFQNNLENTRSQSYIKIQRFVPFLSLLRLHAMGSSHSSAQNSHLLSWILQKRTILYSSFISTFFLFLFSCSLFLFLFIHPIGAYIQQNILQQVQDCQVLKGTRAIEQFFSVCVTGSTAQLKIMQFVTCFFLDALAQFVKCFFVVALAHVLLGIAKHRRTNVSSAWCRAFWPSFLHVKHCWQKHPAKHTFCVSATVMGLITAPGQAWCLGCQVYWPLFFSLCKTPG